MTARRTTAARTSSRAAGNARGPVVDEAGFVAMTSPAGTRVNALPEHADDLARSGYKPTA